VRDIDDLLRKARSGNKDAVCDLLSAHGVDSTVIAQIAGWHSSRSAFVNLVNARKHYVRRGWLGISKPKRIKELIDMFALQPNVANNIASGHGYTQVREEAHRQLKAEADETESHHEMGNPTA
jgi:hypothetical protein